MLLFESSRRFRGRYVEGYTVVHPSTYRRRYCSEDDDDDDVIAEQTAAATEQVLQRARSVAARFGRQEPTRRLLHRAGRTQGGRDTGTALCQFTQRDQRTLRRTAGTSAV